MTSPVVPYLIFGGFIVAVLVAGWLCYGYDTCDKPGGADDVRS